VITGFCLRRYYQQRCGVTAAMLWRGAVMLIVSILQVRNFAKNQCSLTELRFDSGVNTVEDTECDWPPLKHVL
jgi:hypothetical protein